MKRVNYVCLEDLVTLCLVVVLMAWPWRPQCKQLNSDICVSGLLQRQSFLVYIHVHCNNYVNYYVCRRSGNCGKSWSLYVWKSLPVYVATYWGQPTHLHSNGLMLYTKRERERESLSTITESFSLMGMKEFYGLEFTLQITSCYEFCSAWTSIAQCFDSYVYQGH